MHSNSSGLEQYCTLLLAKEQTRPEVKTPAFCVVCKKKLEQVSPIPLLPSLQIPGKNKLTARSHTLTSRTEDRGKRLYAIKSPEQLHEG